MDKIKKLNLLNSEASASDVNNILRRLNTVSGVNVYEKEITFKNASDRKIYCKEFPFDNIDEFGLSSDMVKHINRTETNIFLCANRDTRANKFTYLWDVSSASKRKQIKSENKRNVLDWHVNVLVYHKLDLFYFDSIFDPEELPEVSTDMHFKSKLMDFFNGAKTNRLPIEKMYATGVGNTTDGQCRCLALKFIKDVLISVLEGKPCKKYAFQEFVRGPRKPSKKLAVIRSVKFG